MKVKALFYFCIFCHSAIIFSQSDFRKGYIIQNSGDTIWGEINYQRDKLMAKECIYRKDKYGAPTHFSPNEINAFRFTNGKYYVSKEVFGKNVFLEYLIKGQISIFYYRDEEQDYYFIQEKGGRLTEVPYEQGTQYKDGMKLEYSSTKHIGVLKHYIKDTLNLHSDIEKVQKPDHHNLIRLAQKYNETCDNKTCIIYERDTPFLKVSFIPTYYITRYRGENKHISEYGALFYFWLPRRNERLFLRTGALFGDYKINGTSFASSRIPFQFEYRFFNHKLKPTLAYGVHFYIYKGSEIPFDYEYTSLISWGLNYQINNKIELIAGYHFEYSPIIRALIFNDAHFNSISYSFNFGVAYTW